MNIHEYLADKGFEMTGEYRKARLGEWYLGAPGPIHWDSTEPTCGNYLILKKLCDSFEFDGQTFRLPEDYELVRVGVPKMSDVEAGYYIAAFLDKFGDVVNKMSESTVSICGDGIYFILKEKESK